MKIKSSVALLVAAAAMSLAHAQTDSHCTAAEKVVFACSTGKKLVSLCASKDISDKKGYMQYRFGEKGKTEMQFPENQTHPKGKFEVNRLTPILDNGKRATLYSVSFSIGAFSYTIDSDYIGSKKDGVKITVEKDKKTVAKLLCQEATVINRDLGYEGILADLDL